MTNGATGEVYDIVIRGGTVFNGAGDPGERADVAIRGDRIAAVGEIDAEAAGTVIDASGLSVAPGFIDIHTHSDISLCYDGRQTSSIGMGVTTQVVGNCALSMGWALDTDRFAFERRWLAPYRARITWSSFGEYLDQVEARGIAGNVVPLAGLGTLRKRIVGLDARPPSADELLAMQREIEKAMEAGAWGVSSGLEYPPSSFSQSDELVELCRAAAPDGIYATHMRNEGDKLVEAVQEALDVAGRAGVPLQISHHKAEGRRNWGKVRTTLDMVDRARAGGMDVQLDQYPYTAFMTALSVQTMPSWAIAGGSADIAARITDPLQRAAIEAEMLAVHPDWADASAWTTIRIGVCRGKPEVLGRTIAELAEEAGKSPIDFVLDLVLETGGYVSAINFSMGEEDIATVMRYPWTSVGSDGVGTNPVGPASADRIHPRAYGTFPRVLGRYVRELGVLSIAEAIQKMSGLPAARLGLVDRGEIRPGFFADITIFDPATIEDRATFEAPHQLAAGIEWVIVNGRPALDRGVETSGLTGRVLRRT